MILFKTFYFRNSCERSDKILTLVQPKVSNYTDGTDAHWEVSKTLKLKRPKSSHTLLLVPRTYASKCKLVNWHNDPVFSREWTTCHTVYTILYYIVTLVVIVPKCLRLQKPTNKSNNSVVKLKTTCIERSRTGTTHNNTYLLLSSLCTSHYERMLGYSNTILG